MTPGSTPSGWSDGGVRISSACSGGTCIGVVADAEGVGIVDTKRDDAPVLHFTHAEWAAFVIGIKNGEFDLDEPAVGVVAPLGST